LIRSRACRRAEHSCGDELLQARNLFDTIGACSSRYRRSKVAASTG
jgi:hypothetical protein